MLVKVGFIGYGNMASAMINGLLESGALSSSEVIVASRTMARMFPLIEKWEDIEITDDNCLAAEKSHLLFICVRSEQVLAVIDEICHLLSTDTHIILINSGVNLRDINYDIPTSKVIPSITIQNCLGLSLICHDVNVCNSKRKYLEELFSSVGKVVIVDEERLEVGTAMTSCGPAFIAMFIDLFAKSVEGKGYSRDEALKMITETTIATASLMTTGYDPSSICDMVATEGGITERGLFIMQNELPPMFNEIVEAILSAHRSTCHTIGSKS
ncbi:MAG: NAD(P)-binding domain-containing protein [Euryarchaeota archaeon]|nr:NAD(P)-binding domain-containing protein [Euryarchaeota archaeon]